MNSIREKIQVLACIFLYIPSIATYLVSFTLTAFIILKLPAVFMKITDLDFEQSISRQRLIFKPSRSYQFDLVFQIIMNVVLLLCMGVNFIEYATYDRNLKSFVYVFVVFILIFNYLLYLKLTEKRLGVITTNNTEALNKARIVALAKEAHWEIRKNSKGIIITFEDCGDRGLRNDKQITRVFLLSDNEVLFTLFTERRRVSFPSPFAKRYMRSDLKKYLL